MCEITYLTLKVIKVYQSCVTDDHWRLADNFKNIVSGYIYDKYDFEGWMEFDDSLFEFLYKER